MFIPTAQERKKESKKERKERKEGRKERVSRIVAAVTKINIAKNGRTPYSIPM